MQTLISIMLYLAISFGPKGVQQHNQIGPPPECPPSGCQNGGGGFSGGGSGGGGGGAF